MVARGRTTLPVSPRLTLMECLLHLGPVVSPLHHHYIIDKVDSDGVPLTPGTSG